MLLPKVHFRGPFGTTQFKVHIVKGKALHLNVITRIVWLYCSYRNRKNAHCLVRVDDSRQSLDSPKTMEILLCKSCYKPT